MEALDILAIPDVFCIDSQQVGDVAMHMGTPIKVIASDTCADCYFSKSGTRSDDCIKVPCYDGIWEKYDGST